MLNYIKGFFIIAFLLAIGTIYFMSIRIRDLNSNLDTAVNNNKAYTVELSKTQDENIVFKHRIEELQTSNDSLTTAMYNIANELKVKDKRLEFLQYHSEVISKIDTLIVRDTIFKEPVFALDTCFQNQYYKICFSLKYPNVISIDNEFYNEKYVVASWHKEPIKPRKWFLPRWFTRKQKIITVDVVDKNPYVKTEQQRFIQIID